VTDRRRSGAHPPFRLGDDWWRRGVVYQIYPRSFADSDGDGTGDLPGIVRHLDHLGPDGLGVDAIWLSPIYPSPGRDGGYDVSDHRAVDPLFGSEADFDRLIAEAHRRGIRVILDLVLNHTSSEHPWFVESAAARSGPKADWYLWRPSAGLDRRGRPRPPNDWVSWFGGPAWTYEPRRGQFYHHTFLAEQPDVDWRVPAVERAQHDVVRSWIARGVDGFRLDTFNVYLKDPAMRSNPVRRGRTAWDRQVHVHDIDQPDLPALLARFRRVVDRAPGRMTVGEMFVGTTEGAAALVSDRHLVFDWELLTRPWSAPAFAAAIRRRERAFGADRWPTVVLSNHDQPRQASRLAATVDGGETDRDAIARAAAVLTLTLRGTPFLYYGEEIGMGDVDVPPAESVDTVARHVRPDFSWWDRSPARTPMPWSAGHAGGFTTGHPWLRLGPDARTRNVAAQAADPDSVLACYRRVLAARTTLRSLEDGSIALVRLGPDVLGYRRLGSGAEVLVLIAFTRDGATLTVPRPRAGTTWRPIAGTHRDLPGSLETGRPFALRGYEGVILATGTR
jgi:alpha-glucosidase